MPGSLMNVDGNVGFVSNSSILVYTTEGDLILNKTVMTGQTSTDPFGMTSVMGSLYKA